MRSSFCCNAIICLLFFLSVNTNGFSQNATIKGIIRYGNEILQSATVTIGGQTKTTNNSGEFSFSVKPGVYTISVTYTGFKKAQRELKAAADSSLSFVFEMIPIDQLGEVVMTGSRSMNERSNLTTPVPVDVFSSVKLSQTGQQDLTQMLNFSAPSINASRQTIDNESVTLRGFDPNHVLILVNGVRYHSTAWINNASPKSNLGRGSVGNDLSSIPFSAIEKIEILRDGASAQYGSDAIAGVINIRLKESVGKTAVRLHAGQYYMGDGLKLSFGFNSGVALKKKGLTGKEGFINYSAEFWSRGSTSRGGDDTGVIYNNYPHNASVTEAARVRAIDDSILSARGLNRKMFNTYDGNSEVKNGSMLINGAYPVGKRSSLFWTSSFNYKVKSAPGSYRYPSDTVRVIKMLYPDGFKPNSQIRNQDFLFMTGIKSDTRNYWHWEISSAYGSNSHSEYVNNSNNASQYMQYMLSKEVPTEFYMGNIFYSQNSSNISLTKELVQRNANIISCNLAMGGEWRIEHYSQQAGDSASWNNYDSTGSRQGGSQPSNGSINANDVISKSRSVLGGYIDIETETRSHFLIDVAGRYEYYTDFGGNLAGKLAARYKLSEHFLLRASIGNGFRAPGIQQRFYQGRQSFRGTSLIQFIPSNNGPVAKAFGIPALEAERSVNMGVGFTAKLFNHISLTVDAYSIEIKNRIILSGVFSKNNSDVKAKLAAYPNVDVAQFYVNAINTRTNGADAVINGHWQFNKTRLELSLAANINHNHVFGPIKTSGKLSDTVAFTNTLFGIEERTTLEKDQPQYKMIFSTTINKGKFGFRLANTLFGRTGTAKIVTLDTLYESFSSKILTDISVEYSPGTWITITAGANNVFDVYPDRLKNPNSFKDRTFAYSAGASPFGFNGGYYYLGMSFNF